MNDNISGIYKILNIVNKKFYIGSSCNMYKRKKEHLRQLELNKHHSIKLQRAYNKYGKDNFVFEIVEYVNKKDLLKREQYWIDKLDAVKNGYNVNNKANKPPSKNGKIPWNKGKKNVYTKETLEKMSKAKINKKITEEHKNKIKNTTRNKIYNTSKSIICIEDNIIFKSINEASRIKKIDRKNISKCCNGERKTAGGFHWAFNSIQYF